MIVIVLAGLAAIFFRYSAHPELTDEAYFEFGANIVNALSIAWLMFVLGTNIRKHDQEFGKAVRKEWSTILLMVFISGAYTMLRLLKTF